MFTATAASKEPDAKESRWVSACTRGLGQAAS
jgi:hypothetical protein